VFALDFFKRFGFLLGIALAAVDHARGFAARADADQLVLDFWPAEPASRCAGVGLGFRLRRWVKPA
jgi:hypothetical protein